MNPDPWLRFAGDITDHALSIAHDDGVYRHLQFRRQVWRPPLARPSTSGMYWFDLITAPGVLIFQGDGDAFVWRRVEDMFGFFRGPVGRINPHYWEEKLVAGRESATRYDPDALREHVNAAAREALADRPELSGLPAAIQRELWDEEEGDESHDLRRVMDFRYWINSDDEMAHRHPDFEFTDVWEWTTRRHTWWYLWACHAIVWGIAHYDVVRGDRTAESVAAEIRATAERAANAPPTPPARLLPVPPRTAPRVVTTHAVGGVL